MRTAEQLFEAGRAAAVGRRLAVARRLLERAGELATDPDLAARIDASRAFVRAEEGDLEGGLRLCDEALGRSSTETGTQGVLHAQRALILTRIGDTQAALASYGVGIRLLTDPLELGKAHVNRGNLYLAQGAARPAGQDFSVAVEQLQRAGNAEVAAMARHNLGYTRLLEGDLVSALALMDQARPVLAPLSATGAALCEQDRAEVLIAAGLVSQGREALRQVARVYGAHRLPQRRGEAELTLARTLAHSDPGSALTAARAARRSFERVGATAWRVRADAVALAAEIDLGRSRPSLLTHGATLAQQLEDQGMRWGALSVQVHLARLVARRGDLAEAAGRLARVRLTAGAPLSLRLLVRDVRAELAEAEGRRARALLQVRDGLADLHAWQSSFGSLDLQTMVIGHGVRLARRGLDLAVATGRPDVVHEWSERARMLASRVQPVRAAADEGVAADLAELRRLTAGDGPSVPSPRRVRELQERVRERSWHQRGSGEVTEPVPLARVRAGLGSDTALVAWVVTDGAVTALVATEGGSSLHHLGPRAELDRLMDGLLADLDVAAAELPDVLARSVRLQLAGRLDDLAAFLVTPVLPRLGDRRVVLTPSGVLAGTPWTLLPGLVGRPVTVAQSATSWLARRALPQLRTAAFVAGPRVIRAEEEVTLAAKGWTDASVVTGPAATAAAVSALAGRVDVLHLAAHGRHSADNPLFSGIELVGGPWYGYDIDQLPRVPSVVLLSACEVGRSTVRYGEELIGMTTAWLHAGVRTVIASPAAVNDHVAHDVLTALHRGLADGLDPAAALAAAVPAVTEDRAPAPFICFG